MRIPFISCGQAAAFALCLASSGTLVAAPAPFWVKSIGEGTWSAVVAENSATDVDPRLDADANPLYPRLPPYEGAGGYKRIWEGWGSGAYSSDHGRCGSILHVGGGREYFGNEIVALNLCGGSNGAPVWQRISEPYTGPQQSKYSRGHYADNTPVTAYNRDLLAFDAGNRALVLVESQNGGANGTSLPNSWVFDLATRDWRGPYIHRGARDGVSAYDSKRGRVWFQPQQGLTGELTAFDTASGRFDYYGWPYRWGVGSLDSMMGYDPVRDRLVMTSFRGSATIMAEHRLDQPNTAWIPVRMVKAPATTFGQHALAWSPVRKAWIVWMSQAGGAVYEVRYTSTDPNGTPVYTWTSLTSNANKVAPIATSTVHNGSFEKFQLVAFDDGAEVLVGQMRLSDGVFAFRLPAPAKALGSAVVAVVLGATIPDVLAGNGGNAPPPAAALAPAATLAAQASAIAPGHWGRINADNTAHDVDPARDAAINPRFPGAAPYNGNTGYRALWEAWNSGVFAPTVGSCGALLYYGGGHNDYWGSQVVALDLCGGVNGGPKWRRLSDPFPGPIAWPYPNGAYPDGSPAPPHTYDLMNFDPGTNSLVILQSIASGPHSAYTPTAWRFSLDTHRWSGPHLHRGARYGASAYDVRRRLIWFQPQQGQLGEFTSYDPVRAKFTYYGWPYVNGVGNLDSLMGYDRLRDKLVLASFRSVPPTLAEHDLNQPATPWKLAIQHDAPAILRGQHAMAWSELRQAWIIWMPHDGGVVYELRFTGTARNGQPEYRWQPLTAAGNLTVPIAIGSSHNGPYEKFQMVSPSAGVELLIGQLRLQDGVFAFRVPAPGDRALPTAAPCTGVGCDGHLEPGWAAVCAHPGVFICDNFGASGSLDGVIYPGDTAPTVDAGHLIFEIPSGSSANAGGQYRVTFPPIGQGEFLAFAYRVKADAAATALPGRKEFVLWRGSSSCTDLELSQTHYYGLPVIVPYTHCGSGHFYLPLGASDFQWHYPDYDCTYHGMRSSLDGCAITHPDKWEDYYIELRIGTYGRPDSRVVMWHKTEGGSWKRYIERSDFTFNGSGGFDQFMLTPYMTGKDPTVAHPPGEVRYDHLIMSTRPFSVDALLD